MMQVLLPTHSSSVFRDRRAGTSKSCVLVTEVVAADCADRGMTRQLCRSLVHWGTKPVRVEYRCVVKGICPSVGQKKYFCGVCDQFNFLNRTSTFYA